MILFVLHLLHLHISGRTRNSQFSLNSKRLQYFRLKKKRSMERIDDLSNLKDFCIQNLEKLGAHITTYICEANNSVEDFANAVRIGKVNSNVLNSNYDQLVHSLTTVLKHALQLSGHLNGNPPSTGKQLFISIDNDCKLEQSLSANADQESKDTTTIENIVSEEPLRYEEEIVNDLENERPHENEPTDNIGSCYESDTTIMDDFANCSINSNQEVTEYKRRDIKIFPANCDLKAFITSINEKSFFICPDDWKTKLLEISNPKIVPHLEPYEEVPPIKEMFGIFKPDEGLLRAIRTSDVYTNDEERDVYDAILLDFGENVTEVVDIQQTYILPEIIKEIPAQVVECFLKKGDLADISSKLHKAINLRVLDNLGNGLNVEEVHNSDVALANDGKASILLDLPKEDDSSFETVVRQPLTNQISKSDWDMLNEEPLDTSNAMRAVSGYIPKDEKRICAFFDPKTGNCFKGSRCRQEHTLLNSKGYTKDLVPSNDATVMDPHEPVFFYKNHQQLLVTPTYIKSLTHFYAHVGETSDQLHPFVWEPENLPKHSNLTHTPHILELVLARFEDNLYYRAQVIDQFNDIMFKVFYIDYGNESVIDITDILAFKDEYHLVAPAQAVLFRIAGVKECEKYANNKYNFGKQFLIEKILNNNIVVEVVEHKSDNVVVNILEPSIKNLSNEMISLGFVNPY